MVWIVVHTYAYEGAEVVAVKGTEAEAAAYIETQVRKFNEKSYTHDWKKVTDRVWETRMESLTIQGWDVEFEPPLITIQ
jgi:hypothetical protein